MHPFRAWAASLPASRGEVRLVHGEVPEIVIDDPPTKNALSPRMMVQLADALAAAARSPVVILRGAEGDFCSGGNLAAVEEHLARPEHAAEFTSFMAGIVDDFLATGALLVGVLQGHALGGGAELVASCDQVFCHPEAKIGFVHARLGVSPGFGGGARLVRRVGAARALRILVEARAMTAAEALELGVVDVHAWDPLPAARAWAQAARALPEAALRGAVALARDPSQEKRIFESLWGGPAHRAALVGRRRR